MMPSYGKSSGIEGGPDPLSMTGSLSSILSSGSFDAIESPIGKHLKALYLPRREFAVFSCIREVRGGSLWISRTGGRKRMPATVQPQGC